MPMPTPAPGENKDTFLAVCMDDTVMLEEYPDAAQRYAVCLTQWDKDRSAKVSRETGNGWPMSPFAPTEGL